MASRWQWPREAAQARKSRAWHAGGPVCSHWSMSACPQAASSVPRLRSQQSRPAADRMLLRACAVGVRGRAAAAALARSLRITCQVA
jgi:hypothetical protein